MFTVITEKDIGTHMQKKNGRKLPRTDRPITKPALKKAVDILGGVTNLALELQVSHGNVSDWLYTDQKVPCHHVPKIVEATKWKVKPEELRPDVYIIKKS